MLSIKGRLQRLLCEAGDVIYLPNGGTLEYSEPNTMPFIADSTVDNFIGIVYPKEGETHHSMIEDFFYPSPKTGKPKFPHIMNKTVRYSASDRFAREILHVVVIDGWLNVYKSDKYVSGRVWFNNKTIGFWSTPEMTLPLLPKLKKFIPEIDDTWILDFDAHVQGMQITVKDVNLDQSYKHRDQAETEAMIMQHNAPDVKRAIQSYRGSKKRGAIANKAGFGSAAAYNNARVVGDAVETKQKVAVYIGTMGEDLGDFGIKMSPLQLFNLTVPYTDKGTGNVFPTGSTVTLNFLQTHFMDLEVPSELKIGTPVYGTAL
jgi:hypothetical protein